jgi:hypothetical protein
VKHIYTLPLILPKFNAKTTLIIYKQSLRNLNYFSAKLTGSTLVKDPSGGVLLVGGVHLDTQVVSDAIYRLKSSKGQWKKLDVKLKTPRFAHTAFFVPDSVTDCS